MKTKEEDKLSDAVFTEMKNNPEFVSALKNAAVKNKKYELAKEIRDFERKQHPDSTGEENWETSDEITMRWVYNPPVLKSQIYHLEVSEAEFDEKYDIDGLTTLITNEVKEAGFKDVIQIIGGKTKSALFLVKKAVWEADGLKKGHFMYVISRVSATVFPTKKISDDEFKL